MRPESAARRAGWVLLAASAAAAASVTDPGSNTRATKASADGSLRLEYRRLDHARQPTSLKLWVAPRAIPRGKLRIRMSHRYSRQVRIERVTPAPERVETGIEDVVFVFNAPKRREGMTIVFDVQPIDVGRRDGRLALVGARSLEFTQYLVP